MLANPNTVAAITSCNFATMINCINSDVRQVTFPHNAPQAENALLLRAKNLANELVKAEDAANRTVEQSSWEEPAFDQNKVYLALKTALSAPNASEDLDALRK